MAVYAIGDIQGCMEPLQRLLLRINFDRVRDRLWFTGDLVNRGPQSLEVLRFVKSLGPRATVVLGNHDLHLLAVATGVEKPKPRDTLEQILRAPDREGLLAWLRTRPLFHHDGALGWVMVHAGLLPQWSLADAQVLAREAEAAIAAPTGDLWQSLYGDLPDRWRDDLRGSERLRTIINAFTRLRFCDDDGKMNLQLKGAPGTQPPGLHPWFQHPERRSREARIVFGHWSTLGLYRGDNVIGLDSGCVWGRSLAAAQLNVEPAQLIEILCAPESAP